MPLVLADRVKVRSRTTGTGTLTLENTVEGFQSFASVGNGNETFYGITDYQGNWEIGRGTYTTDSTVEFLSRDQVLDSSNGKNLLDLIPGSKNIFCTFPSSLATATVLATGPQGPIGPPGPEGPQGPIGSPGNQTASGVLTGNNITFTREDTTTFTVDVTALYDDTNLVTSVNGNTGAITVQETLVSSTNIKTINNESLLGSGNIDINSAEWGNITGTLSSQTDLQNALDTKLESSDIADFETTTQLSNRDTANRDRANHTGSQAIATVTGLQDALNAKQDELVSGTNIKTVDGNSILGSGNITINNKTITLSGDVSGSGTTSISVQLGANVVSANELNVTGDGTAGQVLSSDADGSFTWVDAGSGGGASAINDLADVTITSPTSGQVLKYNGTIWVNDTDDGGTGSGVTLTDFSATTPIVYNNTTGAFSHATSGVSPSTYGGFSGSAIIKIASYTVNDTGHITSVTEQDYNPPTAIITGIDVNNTPYLTSNVNGKIAFVAGDNVTLSATLNLSGFPELTISSTGGGSSSQSWYNAVATTSPDTTLDKPADYDASTFIADKLVVGGNDPSFTSGAQPSPGSWFSSPATIGGTIYTSSGDPSASFTVSSGTGGYRWIMTPNNTGFSSGTSSFNNSGSGTTVSYPSNGLPSLPSTVSPASEVDGMVAYDAAAGGPGALTATNCTIHEEVTANNVTYVFWSMTKAQSDNVFNGQAMITSANFASFVTNYFYKNDF
jgi:hypothetical protein